MSALITPAGNPAAIYAWEGGKFALLTCAEQLRATLQKPKVAELIRPARPAAS
ncbi:MAG TPA: hypothetical protein VMZ52_17685 [Bryobacteraceae bacterium]|nr:hypothetical protein [Bryobacteraceae bacterium]